jgi:signal transduction histidine kinase
MAGRRGDSRGEARLARSVLTGVAVYRWAALAWLVAVQIGSRGDLGRPMALVVLVGGAVVITAALTVVLVVDHRRLLARPVVVVELVYGFALLALDGWVYDTPHTQSLGAAWPLAGVMTAGIAFGAIGGGIAGVGVGLGRVVATHLGSGTSTTPLSLISTCVLYLQAGAVAGFVFGRLRTAEAQISAARAREEVARTLHDGVLQTLAVVQRRSSDPELATLAREQERDLRDYLFGVTAVHTDLLTRLRAAAGRFERIEGTRAEVIAVEEPSDEDPRVTEALAGAVGEALANAAKHGGASHVVVFVEPDDDEVFVSVKDDGVGFDTATTAEGVGLSRSIRGRLAEVGGRVEVDARPGRGTEVRLWAPVRLPR